MTTEQGKAIVEMRVKGFGYRAIASELGLSRDIVRNFCIKMNLNGYAKDFANMQSCANCGALFQPPHTGRPRRFCSEPCRREYWKMHMDELKTVKYSCMCNYCGKIFMDKNISKKYCSHDCYIHSRFYHQEDAEALAQRLANGEDIPFLPEWMYEALKKPMQKYEETQRRIERLNQNVAENKK